MSLEYQSKLNQLIELLSSPKSLLILILGGFLYNGQGS